MRNMRVHNLPKYDPFLYYFFPKVIIVKIIFESMSYKQLHSKSPYQPLKSFYKHISVQTSLLINLK